MFIVWLAKDVFGLIGDGSISPYILDLVGSPEHPRNLVAIMSILIMLGVYVFFAMILSVSNRYKFNTTRRRRVR